MAPKRRAEDIDGSDDDDAPSFGRQILPVAALPDGFDGEPVDGLQYLFTVRREFHRLPHVTRAANPYELPSAPAPAPQTAARPSRLPSAEWRTTFERRFRNFRQNIPPPGEGRGVKVLPDMRDRDKWWQFLRGAPASVWNPPKRPKVDKGRRQQQHGRDRPREDDILGPWTPVNPAPPAASPVKEESMEYESEWQLETPYGHARGGFAAPDRYSVSTNDTEVAAGSSTHGADLTDSSTSAQYTPPKPTPTLLKDIDSRYALHVLMYFAHWIHMHLEHLNDPTSVSETPHVIGASHLAWVFALLARVEDVPSADDTAQLRSLARGCVGLVKAIGSNAVAVDDYAVGCWMVLAAVSGVWAQHDLWDDAEETLSVT